MYRLVEMDQAVIIGVSAGFIGGLLSQITSAFSGLMIRKQRINPGVTARRGIFLGFAMGIFTGVIIFAIDSVTVIPVQNLIRTAVASGISVAFIPIIMDVKELIFSKISHQQQGE
jgi:hypothetical protein